MFADERSALIGIELHGHSAPHHRFFERMEEALGVCFLGIEAEGD